MSKKTKSKKKGNKLTSNDLQREILKLFRRSKNPLNPKQVSRKLKVANNKDSIEHAMHRLAENNQLVELEQYKFKLKKSAAPRSTPTQTYEGVVDMTRSGAGYILVEELENDVYVAAKNMNTAQHDDRVRIRIWTPRGRSRPEGEVLQVIERATEHFIGILWMEGNYAMVVPDKTTHFDIMVPLEETLEAADGDKVVVKVEKWTNSKFKNPVGRVTAVLGAAGSHDIEMKAILLNNGFELTFPEEVLQESNRLPDLIEEEEITQRRDMREVTTFTIDPLTAKDFDDALSIRYLDNGDCEVGIHIADVTHYVRSGSELDEEAFKRSTSVYLVDRVLPMLPERLSNELCSLRPEEDKLTFSAVFVFNKNGRVAERWFGKSIIHSNRRFTYEEVQEILERGEGNFHRELKELNKLAKGLRKQRFQSGAINFETDEVKFRLDEEGAPVEVYVKERKDAHLLVEDFMLLANREVATYISHKGKDEEVPFIYRVHDEPDPDRVVELARFAREMDFEMNISSPRDIGRSYNLLVKRAAEEPSLKLLQPIAIRTMAKAEYTTENIGHYGLAFDYYTHFTSPIRRYSDVLAHRILEANLGAGQFKRPAKKDLEEQCKHVSRQERRAMNAERESVKYKQVEFMEKHLGEVFPGFVSGIMDRGIFVELEGSRCEGMVSFETMDEFFEPDDSGLRVIGRRSGKVIRMGDRVQVRIVRTDLARRQIDMAWVE